MIDMLKQRLDEALVKHHFVESAEAVETVQELCKLIEGYLTLEK